MASVQAQTLCGPRDLQLRSYPVPVLDGPGALLDLEANALCGTDLLQYRGEFGATTWPAGPLIPGHEMVGVIREGDPDTLRRWGVTVGDRIAVEPNLPCGSCRQCLTGRYTSCSGHPRNPMAFGFIPVSEQPSLWGGYAELAYLPANAVIHRVPAGMDIARASLFNVMANGFQWATVNPELRYGQTVLVLGPGPRGLACAAAALAAGASRVVVTGLRRHDSALDAARMIGASTLVVEDQNDPAELAGSVRDLLGGTLADVTVDCTSGATSPVIDAVHCTTPGGTVVLAGLKGGRPVDGVPVDHIALNELRIVGARSATWESYERGLAFLAAEQLAFPQVQEFALSAAEEALRSLAGEIPGERTPFVALVRR